jgi:hypothetical protein
MSTSLKWTSVDCSYTLTYITLAITQRRRRLRADAVHPYCLATGLSLILIFFLGEREPIRRSGPIKKIFGKALDAGDDSFNRKLSQGAQAFALDLAGNALEEDGFANESTGAAGGVGGVKGIRRGRGSVGAGNVGAGSDPVGQVSHPIGAFTTRGALATGLMLEEV